MENVEATIKKAYKLMWQEYDFHLNNKKWWFELLFGDLWFKNL